MKEWRKLEKRDFAYLENKFSILKEGEPLTVDLLRELKKHFPFKKYWYFPRLKKPFGRKLEEKTKNLFEKSQEEIIRTLTEIFKNIEVVSIILRFADPENYGITSAPTRYMVYAYLEISKKDFGKNVVEEYMSYLKKLREFKEILKLDRIADVDMALWAIFHKGIFNPNKNECALENCRVYQEFWNRLPQKGKPVKTVESIFSFEKLFESYLSQVEIPIEKKIKYSKREPNPPKNLDVYIKKIAQCPYIREVRCERFIDGKGETPRFNCREDGKIIIDYFDRESKGAKLIIPFAEETKNKVKLFLYSLALYYWLKKIEREKIEGFNSLENLIE